MTKIVVVAAVVDTQRLTLYKEDGSTVVIPQGDPRVARLITEITPFISRGKSIEVDITANESSVYAQYEKQAKKEGGLTRFFRVAKKAVTKLFEHEEVVPPMELGNIPAPAFIPGVEPPPEPRKEETLSLSKIDEAIKDIMAHAVAADDPKFDEETVGEDSDNTVVAVVTSDTGQKVLIPSIENLRPQLARAAAMGSTNGMERFMARMASIAQYRNHTVQELLRFMQRGDLPIADDGSIIIYKVLKTRRDKPGLFFDIHSGNVPQRIGSYVHMDPRMVDPDRRQECSHGLHVARRGYLSGFDGDVCVLAKVAPEDVIAVPDYDANKMRVCGYHILFRLSSTDHGKLRNNRPMTDTTEAQQLLAKAMSGEHVVRIESVKIGGPKGTNITVTPLLKEAQANQSLSINQQETDRMETALPDNGVDVAPVVPPKVVTDLVTEAKAEDKPAPDNSNNKPLSRTERCQALYKQMTRTDNTELERVSAAQELKSIKNVARKGWAVLGLHEGVGKEIALVLEPSPAPSLAPQPKFPDAPVIKRDKKDE